MAGLKALQIQDFLVIRRPDNSEPLVIDLRDGEVLSGTSETSLLVAAVDALATYITSENT